MTKFNIVGGNPLQGIVTPSGNKNAALPLLAACLLTEETVTLRNLPDIHDVRTMGKILRSLGAEVIQDDPHTWRITAASVREVDIDPEECRRIRASILLAGPLAARTGALRLPPPGGDVIGRRKVDTHFLALRSLGAYADYNREENVFQIQADGLTGADILLDEASVTATENAIMAAATAKGTTVVHNAASEPHVQELCQLLNLMGAKISAIGSNSLIIEGVDQLGGAEFTIGPDYLEVVSFIGATVMTGGEVRIRNAGPEYLKMVRLAFNRMGIHWEEEGRDILVSADQSMVVRPDLDGSIPEIKVMPWPSFPSDLMSIAIVTATKVRGSILFHDWMYEGRMYFTDKLVKMGAQIVLCDPHRCIVQGPARLYGSAVESPDIRAGLSLVMAALSAEGTSVIRNVGQIDRGYERIDEKLRALGAQIERID
jgi:UDP-N-acetylglucosamine 1-carboxyvinyltransferase